MTVIAYRDGILAADSAGWIGGVMFSDKEQKARRLANGYLCGCCGDVPRIEAFHGWIERGRPVELPFTDGEENDFGAIVVDPQGIVTRYDHKLRAHIVSDLQPFAVEGCYDEFMLALMLAGKSAVEAIELAIRYCAYAGGTVHSVRLGDA